MKIYKNKHFKISTNPGATTDKSPTHHQFIEGRKKDGTTFMMRIAALWRSKATGEIKGTMIEGNTNPNTGVYYSGYSIIRDSDIDKAEQYVEYLENLLKNNRIPFDNQFEQKLPPAEQMQMNFDTL
jgi:hypothetical protein